MAIAAVQVVPRLAWAFRRVSALGSRPPWLVISVDRAALAGTFWDVLAVSTLCVQCVFLLVGDVLEAKTSLSEWAGAQRRFAVDRLTAARRSAAIDPGGECSRRSSVGWTTDRCERWTSEISLDAREIRHRAWTRDQRLEIRACDPCCCLGSSVGLRRARRPSGQGCPASLLVRQRPLPAEHSSFDARPAAPANAVALCGATASALSGESATGETGAGSPVGAAGFA
jgi:hypothetical protein